MAFIGLIEFMPEILNESEDDVFTNDVYKYEAITLQQIAAVPSILLATFLVQTPVGRKWTLAVPFIVSGVFACMFMFAESYSLVRHMQIMLFSTLNNLCSLMGFSAMYTITPESYGTEVRNMGVGFVNALGKFGAIAGPFVLGMILDFDGGKTIALSGASIVLVLTGFLSGMLYETRGRSIS